MLLQFYGACFQRKFGEEWDGAVEEVWAGERCEKEDHGRAGHGAAETG